MESVTPLGVTPGEDGIILVGGTFDPPHRGHTDLAVAARRRLGLSGAWLVFVPAGRSPFKEGVGDETPARHRVAMIRRAVEGIERSAVWTDEVDRRRADEPSYWVETLGRLRSLVGAGVAVRFLIGADQAGEFHRWREPRRILGLAAPVVLPRGDCGTVEQLGSRMHATGAWGPEDVERWKSRLVEVGLDEVSSTLVRDALSRGRPEDVATFMDPRVLAYIREHDLYGIKH